MNKESYLSTLKEDFRMDYEEAIRTDALKMACSLVGNLEPREIEEYILEIENNDKEKGLFIIAEEFYRYIKYGINDESNNSSSKNTDVVFSEGSADVISRINSNDISADRYPYTSDGG